MKTFFLVSVFSCMAIVANAQLRVTSNGNVSLQSSEEPLSALSIGSEGVDDYFIGAKGSKQGILTILNNGKRKWGHGGNFISYTNNGNNFSVGLSGSANASDYKDNIYGRAFGVVGIAGNATSGWNYGLYGKLRGSNNGSAVYGTIDESENGICLDDRYAGYFNGPVKVSGDYTVDGDLIINGFIDGVALGEASENVDGEIPVSMQDAEQGTANKLAGLKAIPYYKSQDGYLSPMSQTYGDTLTLTTQMKAVEVQSLTKKHYALSAEQLESVYPDFVYTKEDGTKGINYMEMIPVLVQSIGELTARIAQLENEKKAVRASYLNNSTDVSSIDGLKTASLSQNNPNPFAYTTFIKANISEAVKDACLLVCDLTGKQIKKISVTDRGAVTVRFTADGLDAGIYLYSLVVDNQLIDTKRMIVAK